MPSPQRLADASPDLATDPSTGAGLPGGPLAWSGVRRGRLEEGEWVRLTDAKGRRHNIQLVAGKQFFSNKGSVDHDEMIGREEGFTVVSSLGGEYLVFRPLLNEFVVSMPRGAAVVYPKDAAQIVAMADIFPGAHVVEAGVGSGALTCSLLRAVGPGGRVSSYERREEFADVARRNVTQFFAGAHPAWELTVGDLAEALPTTPADARVDRVVLDMLAPWECIDAVADALVPGGLVCAYVATTTQLEPDGGDPAGARRLHRAPAVGDPGPRLARGGACRAPGPPDERSHRLPGHRTPDGAGPAPPGQAPSSGAGRLRRPSTPAPDPRVSHPSSSRSRSRTEPRSCPDLWPASPTDLRHIGESMFTSFTCAVGLGFSTTAEVSGMSLSGSSSSGSGRPPEDWEAQVSYLEREVADLRQRLADSPVRVAAARASASPTPSGRWPR